MKDLEQLLAAWALLQDNGDIQHQTAQALDDAQEAGNEALMAQICRYVIGQDSPNHLYSPDFQITCLHWLTEDCIERLNRCEDEAGREAVWQELSHCLWAYKWFVYELPLMPEMPREQIDFYNELMQDYYQRGGMSMAAVHKTLMLQAMNMGDIDAAKSHYRQWHEAEGDDFADCEACELSDEVHYHHFIGQYKKAAQLAAPILDGRMRCGEVPHNTYYPAIDSLIESDQWAQAEKALQAALNLIESEGGEFVHLLPRLIQLHIKLGQYDRAQALADKHYEAISNRSQNHPIISLHYLAAVARFDEAALGYAQELVALYDQRNGNAYYGKQLQQLLSSQQRTLQ